jgi:hypothetical protein
MKCIAFFDIDETLSGVCLGGRLIRAILLLLLSFSFGILLFLIIDRGSVVRADMDLKTCPLRKEDITGVMQWNDGWPMSYYGRATHGILPIYQPVDINGYFDSRILSPVRGRVYRINREDRFVPGGVEVVIFGDDGLYYAVAHVTSPRVVEGTLVANGDWVGSVVSEGAAIQCDLSQDRTTPDCTKAHVHFDVYSGNYENPSSSLTLAFISEYCGLNRRLNDATEFPLLPSINCAKITGNENIRRCFAVDRGGLVGDANGDGIVNGVDYTIWLNHFGVEGVGGSYDGDFNNDWRTNGQDYVIWLNVFRN